VQQFPKESIEKTFPAAGAGISLTCTAKSILEGKEMLRSATAYDSGGPATGPGERVL